jgi:hypothetical protein
MSVYVDDAFTHGDWGRWTGGGHLQADTEAELHEFAQRLGLKRSWFQAHRRPEFAHYDLTSGKRSAALGMGAIAETAREAAKRNIAAMKGPLVAGPSVRDGER